MIRTRNRLIAAMACCAATVSLWLPPATALAQSKQQAGAGQAGVAQAGTGQAGTGPAGAGQAGVFGVTPDGKSVHTYTLRNAHGMTVTLMDLGATVLAVNAPDRDGRFANVVLAFKDLAAYATAGPVNAVVGRYANRIGNGFTLDGQQYPLKQNARGITLHGGTDPYSNRLWTVRSVTADAITFALNSPDGDQGFPGALQVEITYRLTPRNELALDYSAIASAATYLNLTNHIYFNLHPCDGCNILDETLEVNADRYTPVDDKALPLGTELPVAGTALDFLQPMRLGARISPTPEANLKTVRGYDYNFVLNGRPGTLRHAATLTDAVSGRRLDVETTEPGLQVFSGGRPHPEIALATGGVWVQSAALALETQHFPDSPNHPGFPSTLVTPAHPFGSRTVFRFSAR